MVPETFVRLLKMLTRWNRSFVRESLILARYLASPAVFLKRKMLTLDFCVSTFISFFIFILLLSTAYRLALDPWLIFRFAGSVALMGFLYMLFYIDIERSWHFIYGIIYSFLFITVLVWILPYSILTMRTNTWGTR